MQKRDKLAAIVNCLSDDELANLSPHAALSLLQAVREQPRTPETDTALKRLTLHLLRESPPDGERSSRCPAPALIIFLAPAASAIVLRRPPRMSLSGRLRARPTAAWCSPEPPNAPPR